MCKSASSSKQIACKQSTCIYKIPYVATSAGPFLSCLNCKLHCQSSSYFTMPPTLVLIRHAQAEHNATNDWSIRDPPLTQLGEQQSRELHESLKQSDIGNQIELIVVSAQRRTLQTATIGLDWLIKKGVPGTSVLHVINTRDSVRSCSRKFASWLTHVCVVQSYLQPSGKKTPINPATQAHRYPLYRKNSRNTTFRPSTLRSQTKLQAGL